LSRCKLQLRDGPKEVQKKDVLRHKKNPEIGTKITSFFHEVYLDFADASDLTEGEEVRLVMPCVWLLTPARLL
jgi:glutamyl-tRNA synthetase